MFIIAEGIEPAAFSFGLDECGRVATGRVNFGLMTEHFPRGVSSRSKLQNYLQAFRMTSLIRFGGHSHSNAMSEDGNWFDTQGAFAVSG